MKHDKILNDNLIKILIIIKKIEDETYNIHVLVKIINFLMNFKLTIQYNDLNHLKNIYQNMKSSLNQHSELRFIIKIVEKQRI